LTHSAFHRIQLVSDPVRNFIAEAPHTALENRRRELLRKNLENLMTSQYPRLLRKIVTDLKPTHENFKPPTEVHRKSIWLPYALIIVFGLITGLFDLVSGLPVLQSRPFDWALLWIVEFLLTIPHELGHAIIARYLGVPNVRILIGFGHPMFSFDILGFRCLVNRIPMGGFTLFSPWQGYTRAKYALIVAAGPAVSAVAMLLTWFFFGHREDWTSISTLCGIFFWANAIVLTFSLLPYNARLSNSETTPNDGLLLLQLAFPHLSPKSRADRIQAHPTIIKRITLVFFSFVAVTFGISGAVLGIKGFSDPMDGTFIFLGGLLTVLAISIGGAIVYVSDQPIITESQTKESSLIQKGVEEMGFLSAAIQDPLWMKKAGEVFHQPDPNLIVDFTNQLLAKFPRDPYIAYFKSYYQWKAGQAAEAAETIQNAGDPSLPSVCKFALAAVRLQYLIHSDQFAAAFSACGQIFHSDASLGEKTQIVDALASFHLYFEKLNQLPELEKWLRLALELDPNNASLKATLGGVLVEENRFAEAEPLLYHRIESAPHGHNQGYALYYMGRIRIAQGKLREARKMLERSTIISDAEWLVQRAAKAIALIQTLS